MIWVGGRIVPDDSLRVSVLDRTFEHGLGLFETLRTWDGRAPLLERHLARMKRSASELGLPYESVMPPDENSVADLVDAEGLGGDVMLRITLTGGVSGSSGSMLWMRAVPLPPPMRREGAIVDLGTWWVQSSDPFSRHKSLNYWSRRMAFEKARQMGFDEVLSISADVAGTAANEILRQIGLDEIPIVSGRDGLTVAWEGSRTNLFTVEGRRLTTSSTTGPIVPGIMRGLVLERVRELAVSVSEEVGISRAELASADEVFLTNSVRGIIPVARMVTPMSTTGVTHDWPAPGPITQMLSLFISCWLKSRGAPT